MQFIIKEKVNNRSENNKIVNSISKQIQENNYTLKYRFKKA